MIIDEMTNNIFKELYSGNKKVIGNRKWNRCEW